MCWQPTLTDAASRTQTEARRGNAEGGHCCPPSLFRMSLWPSGVSAVETYSIMERGALPLGLIVWCVPPQLAEHCDELHSG